MIFKNVEEVENYLSSLPIKKSQWKYQEITFICERCKKESTKIYRGLIDSRNKLLCRSCKVALTCLDRYGVTNSCNKPGVNHEFTEEMKLLVNKKRKATKLAKYGDENYNGVRKEYTKEEKALIGNKISRTKLNFSESKKSDIREKIRTTKLEKYGDKFYNNSNKISETRRSKSDSEKEFIRNKTEFTNLSRYGVKNTFQLPKSREKAKKYFMDNFGVTNSFSIPEVREKIRNTNFSRYGVYSTFESKDFRDIIKDTNINKYGVEYPIQSELIKVKQSRTRKNNYIKKISSEAYINNRILYYNKRQLTVLSTRIDPDGYPVFSINCNICNKSFEYKLKDKQAPFCENCRKSGVSKNERYLLNYIESLINSKEIVENTRKVITPKELDIYIPSKNLAIEYDGLYWHSNTEPNYHLDKTNLCNEKGIELLHIFESEWLLDQDIVKSIIKSKLGIYDTKIYARKCIVKELDNNTYKDFCNENHLQGYSVAKVRLGLYYNDELIQIMSFSKPRFNKKYEYEMIRESSKIGYAIVGGKEKLFKSFIKNYNPKSIISYCDKRYFNGNSYLRLGFTQLDDSAPNYWYFKLNSLELHNRIEFQKHKLKDMLDSYDETLSEYENMELNGYARIFDCGNKVFIWENNI